jgi:hypothetical protein
MFKLLRLIISYYKAGVITLKGLNWLLNNIIKIKV